MEKTDKSAEGKLTSDELAAIWIDGLTPGCTNNSLNKDRLSSDMNEFAAQQLSEYKEVIKELLPFATSSKLTVDDPNWRELWENKTKIIDRAKKLID